MSTVTSPQSGIFAPLPLMGAGFGMLLAAGVATAAPVLTYTLSLAVFGLPHVVAELRYIDVRFNARLTRSVTVGLLVLLAGLVLIRGVAIAGWVDVDRRRLVDLWLLFGMVTIAAPHCWQAGRSLSGRALWLGLLAALAYGVVSAPAATLVIMALAHNLTPVGFLAERFAGAARRRALLLCAIFFGVVPLAIVTGLPWMLLESLGWTARDASLVSTGPLETHLPAFVFAGLRESPIAQRLFSAAVYLQCLHYFVVIHILPRLIPDEAVKTRLFHWPSRKIFTRVLVALGAVFFVGFALSFNETKSTYAVFAAVHAWVEIPVLLLALSGLKQATAEAT